MQPYSPQLFYLKKNKKSLHIILFFLNYLSLNIDRNSLGSKRTLKLYAISTLIDNIVNYKLHGIYCL